MYALVGETTKYSEHHFLANGQLVATKVVGSGVAYLSKFPWKESK